jgi:hypothetical protein
MNNEWVKAQQRKLDDQITAEYVDVTSPQAPDDDWIYGLDRDAGQAWFRGTWLPKDAG